MLIINSNLINLINRGIKTMKNYRIFLKKCSTETKHFFVRTHCFPPKFRARESVTPAACVTFSIYSYSYPDLGRDPFRRNCLHSYGPSAVMDVAHAHGRGCYSAVWTCRGFCCGRYPCRCKFYLF